jgi:anti-sigma B factor antagonist
MKLIEEYTEGGVDVLRLAGEIDMHFAPGFRALLQAKAKRKCPALLVDLTEVNFIDSVGIAAILEYLRDATDSGARFCIGGLTPTLRTIFEVVGIGRVMPVYADAGKAKEAFLRNRLPEVSTPLFAAAA